MRRRLAATALIWLFVFSTQTSASVMLGAFVPGNGWNQENITTLNDQLHKKLSFITLFSAFTEDWDQLYWQTSKVVDAGMVPMISWMPIDQTRKEVNILPEISAGLWDDYITEWSRRFMEWRNAYAEGAKPVIMLRFGHEFNGNWYSYSDAPEAYQAAYRHVHALLQQQGVNEYIEWVWCANNLNIDTINDITRYYPGGDYVDWTSIDGYNWGSNYQWTNWESFTEVYADAYRTLVTHYPDKPVLIAEYGSAEPADVPDPLWGQNGDNSDINENKDAWVHDMLVILEEQFPAIRAVSLFNINKELGWSITDAGNTGLTGMNLGLANSYFVSEYISASEFRKRRDAGPGEPSMAYAHDDSVINPHEQRRLARSRLLPEIRQEKIEKQRQGFLTMERISREQFSDLKHSVLDE